MPKGTEAQQHEWACSDCKYAKIVDSSGVARFGVSPETVKHFQCLHADPKVRKAAKRFLATCDSWEPIDD